MKRFCADKTPGEDVFHLLTTSLLNQKLTSYMEGLTAKVFRTFNASVTLEQVQRQVEELEEMLRRVRAGEKVKLMPEKYQAPLPKLEIPEDMAPEEAERRRQQYREERAERAQFSHMYKSQPSEEQVAKRLETFRGRLATMTIKLKDLDNNKLVALGTSKINYMDPRITVAWCKRVGVGKTCEGRIRCRLRRFSPRR